jgi:hypothetical protein
MNQDKYRPFNEDELINQLGHANIYAISGGRVDIWRNNDGDCLTMDLPVGYGYRVQIYLDWDDTYTVIRQYKRKGVVTDKGSISGVYCDQVGEIAYKASCFRNIEFGIKTESVVA